jgi:hypothetical protein
MPLPPVIDPAHVSKKRKAENSFTCRHRPRTPISGASRIEFLTNKNYDCALDVSKTELSVRFKVVKKDGTGVEPAKGKIFSLINNVLFSFFNTMTITVNQTQVSQNVLSHYLSYFIALFNHSSDYRQSALVSSGWFEQEHNMVGAKTSTVHATIADMIKSGKEVAFVGRILNPFFLSTKFLPPATELGLTLIPNTTEFMIFTDIDDAVKIEFTEIELITRYVKLPPQIHANLKEAMNTKPYIYNYNKTDIRSFVLSTGIKNFNAFNIFSGQIPSRVIFTMADSDAVAGSKGTSPFKFAHNNMKSFKFVYNDVQIPINDLKYNLKGVEGMELYNYVNGQLSLNRSEQFSPMYTYEQFLNDFFCISTNFQDDVSVSPLTTPYSPGSLSLEISFEDALTKNLTLILLAEFDQSYFEIDKNGVVTLH